MLSLKQNGKRVELQEERDWKWKMVADILLEARKVVRCGKGSPGFPCICMCNDDLKVLWCEMLLRGLQFPDRRVESLLKFMSLLCRGSG